MTNIRDTVKTALDTTLRQTAPFTLLNFSKLPLFTPFRRMTKIPTLIGAVVSHPLDYTAIVYDGMPATRLPIGNLIYATSLNVLCAYVFEIPNYRVDVFPHYMTVYRPDAVTRTEFEDSKLIHQNQHINVFWSEHGCMLINFVGRNKFFEPNDLRGGH